MIRSFASRLRGAWKRRYYLWSRIRRPQVPLHSLSWLPDGFVLAPVADTGITVVDGFCMPGAADDDPALTYRAAFLSGLSDGYLRASVPQVLTTHQAEMPIPAAITTDYRIAVFPNAALARLVIMQANRAIEIDVLPGRAIGWPGVLEARVLLGQGQAAVNWFLFEYAATRQRVDKPADDPRQARTGQPLTGVEVLPAGVWAPGADHLEAVFGKPDVLTDLIGK